MRLERLEVSGFKSFSDRSELAFDRGVTAIVGPNGCGKSNLADALTWVLGEQSAKSLRGDKMEDVIFSGSDARKPTGAAEVRLRLSNVAVPPSLLKELGDGTGPGGPAGRSGHVSGNGHAGGNGHGVHADRIVAAVTRDVEVTRRLYRSGESEYLIDGRVCRLRDIHELLMDTGLGAKAYAIIEQGKIGMILSSRPTDRRQLIEEAAGITKYKARRRAAELKLEAARQNLTRLDDIVFEVEKQRASMQRQAAKARRYTRLRDEMRRWEKVLFARRYRVLADAIDHSRARLSETRAGEEAAAARLAEGEAGLSRLRLELASADAAATAAREALHARELEITRRQQQIALDSQQAEMLDSRADELEAERRELEARREPERVALQARRRAAEHATTARDDARARAAEAADDYARAQQAIETADQDVERARADVYAVTNTITAISTALDSATAQRERAVETRNRLELEARELSTELGHARAARQAATEELRRAHAALEAVRLAQAARESELAHARREHEWRARELRTREHELAAMGARLASLEEIDTERSGFADAARMVLVHANGKVGQMGACADFLEVEPRYERAVEACLGDLLQYVLVERLDHVRAGLALIRQHGAGRCGFIVGRPDDGSAAVTVTGTTEGALVATSVAPRSVGPGAPEGTVPLAGIVKVGGPFPAAIQAILSGALVAESFDLAARVAPLIAGPVATLDGHVFRGRHLVTGGEKTESRGILATKREIKELREKIGEARSAVERLAGETAAFEQAIAEATAAVTGLSAELHRQEKAIVGVEALGQRATEDTQRLQQRVELIATEISRAEEEIRGLDARQAEARESLAALGEQKDAAERTLSDAQRRLGEARDVAERLSQAAAEARAAHAGLAERSAAAAAEVGRLEEAAAELERRVEGCARDVSLMRAERDRLRAGVADSQRLMDDDVQSLEALRADLVHADEQAQSLTEAAARQEEAIRDRRRALDALRALAAELDVQRATADAELAHLAQQTLDAVNLTLDQVREEVAQMEAAGQIEPDVQAIRAAEAVEPEEAEPGEPAEPAEPAAAAPARMSAEEAIAELRGKLDRMGPVNMMALEQFTELDQRLTFLTTQRADLLESIAQTNEAIRRIDDTTHARFREAFAAINANFQATFATLFGGGRAGLALLDEADPLESGIDIVASPPGKRLQNVMLLSGGEKALTAIALMFAIFRYKPSPFCLLDEIDAPLDDANIGRFVEMLRSMMDRTQFIIITHNRKTMEIADRLYGVTMEEPGVSKLISITLN
jgi:chromosome segregation protein